MKLRAIALLLALVSAFAAIGIALAEDPPPDLEQASPAATEPTPSPAAAPIINLVFNWDFDVISTAVRRSLQETFGGIAGGIQRNVLDPLKGSSLNFLTQTPAGVTYANPTVVGLWGYARAVASAAFALVILVVGYGLLAGGATSDFGAIPSLRGALLGLVFANTSLWWIGLSVDLGNALTGGIGAVTLPSAPGGTYTTLPFEQILVALIYLVMAILLILQMLMRLALLDVLIVISPIAVLLGGVPQGERWSRLWRDLFVACLISQFAQVLALRLGTTLTTQLLPNPADSIVGSLAGIAVLVVTLRIPGLLNVGLARAGGGVGVVGTIFALRAARGLIGGRTATHGASGGGATAVGSTAPAPRPAPAP